MKDNGDLDMRTNFAVPERLVILVRQRGRRHRPEGGRFSKLPLVAGRVEAQSLSEGVYLGEKLLPGRSFQVVLESNLHHYLTPSRGFA